MRKVDVLVKGPGSGRETAIRSIQNTGIEVVRHQGRHADPAQRLPPAEAAEGLMARYTGPVCRLCRRERMKLFLKGAKCDSMKCPIERRPYPPGQHGRGRIRESEYLLQLREKQKARRIYGLLEKQFRNLYAEANRQAGITGENLLRMLELRLDNVVFRAGFAREPQPGPPVRPPRPRHGQRQAGDDPVVPGAQGRRRRARATRRRSMIVVRHNLDTLDRAVPLWLEVDRRRPQGDRARPPLREQIDVPVREQLIVELYSK